MKTKGLKGLVCVILVATFLIFSFTAYAKTGDYAGLYSITYNLSLYKHKGTATTSGAAGTERNYASITLYDKNGASLGCASVTAKTANSTNASPKEASATKSTGLKTVKKGKSYHAVCDSTGKHLASYTQQLTITKTR